MVAFALRSLFSFANHEAVLAKHGRVTEKVGDVFRKCLFTSLEEHGGCIADSAARGLDPSGSEDDGWLFAKCDLSRPSPPEQIS
ncbi:hypothetical protein GE09DRAFT_1079378 [Coniochaeta sp. 2T2.1]|nr:hypothetical protein GE09DRAFT_1079378 [Coniochaeta sp. 2T2.1]